MTSKMRSAAIIACHSLTWVLTAVLVYWVAVAPTLTSLGAEVGRLSSLSSYAGALQTAYGAVWWVSLVRVVFSALAVLLLVLGIVASTRYVYEELGSEGGSRGEGGEQYLGRMNAVDRASHLMVLLGGFTAGITGFTLHFADDPFIYAYVYSPVGRDALADLHVVGGYIIATGVALYLSFYLTDFALHLRSLGLKGALSRYYLIRLIPSLPRGLTQYFAWMFWLRKEHPQYSKYMPSQVLAFYSTGALVMLVGLTGLSMVVWGMQTLNGLAWWAHVYAAVALTALIAFHVSMGHTRPSKFPIDKVFVTGRVPLSEARREWPLWVEEVLGKR